MRLAISILFALIQLSLFAQPGKDGALVVTAPNTVVNCYSPVTNDVTAGTSSVTVNNSGGDNCNWQCGDLIMLIQMQGATINTSNTSAYGSITNYNTCGVYQLNYITGMAGNTIFVQDPWTSNYDDAGRVQVVKIPQYTSLTVNAGASIIPLAWQDGGAFRKGGIVAIHCQGTITVNGSIHATGFGFRPGPLENASSAAGAGIVNLYVSNNQANGGAKGESIAGFNDVYDAVGRYGRGAPANGGGGGNGHNCGGGGGSNANNGNPYTGQGVMCTGCAGSASWTLDPGYIAAGGFTNSSGGGRGGYSYGGSNQNALTLAPGNAAWAGDFRDPFGGEGGHPLTATVPANRIFMGGGGGAGDRNNNANMLGGTGGGIVYLMANNVTGSGQINANGSDALNQIALGTGGNNDAPGGAGGGGTIIIRSASMTGVQLNARGGKGGDQAFLATESEGPGGGGGGGYIAFSSGAPTTNVTGGVNGITLSGSLTEFTPNGATSGADGQVTTVANITLNFDPFGPIVTTSNSPVCVGSTIVFNTTTVAGCTYTWSGPAGFTSTAQNPTRPGATLPMEGTYQVIYTTGGACTDTNTVFVDIVPLPVITPAVTNPLCNGSCTGTINAVTTVGAPTYTYSWSTGASTQIINSLCVGSYTVTVTDANGCVATSTSAITQPPAITGTVATTNPLCNGSTNGTITVTASGGTGTLNYSLNGGTPQVSPTFSGLAAGAYTITVTDANGCTFLIPTSLTNPTAVSGALVSTIPATCGLSNGSITVSASGGTGTYTYDLNPGPVQASPTFTGLAPGSYSVVVTDGNGCSFTVTGITISSFPSPIPSILATDNITCFGGLDGSVLIGVTGGTAPIQYQIDLAGPPPPTPLQLSNSFTGLVAGNYTVTVVDANGCTGTTTFTITSPPILSYTTTFTNALCNGVCNGTITVTPSGGVAPYSFSSNAGLTFGTANPMTGLCAGTTFVVVQDANGCLANSVVMISQPAALNATYTLVNPICPDICNGQVTVATTTGGTAPYDYSVNGGPFGPSTTLTGLCDGANTIVIEDANGCQLTSTQTLVDPPHYVINVVDTSESHCGFNDGSLEVAASGGAAPYSYTNVTIGVGPQPTGFFDFLVGGSYLIEVVDDNGCIEQTFVGVNDVEMDGILDGLTPATCYGYCDGTVQTHAILGSIPIQYELDLSGVFQLNGDFTGLCEGNHIVTIVDNGFCIFTIPFYIDEPDSILFSSTVTNVNCNGGATGTITITGVTGGNGVYQYSIDGGGSFQASPNFTGLIAGTYNLMVMDGNGCLGSGTAIIIEAPPLSYTANITDLTCFNNNSGFLQIVASGGTGAYSYSITGGAPFGSGFTFLSLAAGTYNIVVQDAAGCQVTGTETINQPTPVTSTYVVVPTLCDGSCDGSITVTPGGGTPPYTFSSNGGTTYQISPTLTGLCAGAYTVMTQDDNGCIIGSVQNVAEPTPVNFVTVSTPETCSSSNGTITFTSTSGGTPTYDYSIDGGGTFVPTTNFTGLTAGNYNVMVEDDNGCQFPGTITIIAQTSPVINAAFLTDASCNALCDGAINATATGGTGALTFDIGGAGQPTGNFTGICDGTYTITVTDVNGCTDNQIVTINEPVALTFGSTPTNLTCFGNSSGVITILAAGGTVPYMYSYDNGSTFTGLNSQTNLPAGTYDLVVTDNNGCIATGTETLTEPTAVTITSTTANDPLCSLSCDGDVGVTVAGGTVTGLYNYNWAGGIAGPTQPTATGLCAGNYSVIVEDDNGCSDTATFTLVDPIPFLIGSASSIDALCTGDCNGSLTISATGGVQYSNDNGATFQASPNFTGLCAGIYNLQALDANGCVATFVGIVNEPLPLQLISTPDSIYCIGATLPLFGFAFGGVGPYNYSWSNGINTQTQNVNPTGTVVFTVTATDANGCVSPTSTTTFTPLPDYTASIAADLLITCPGEPVTLTVTMGSGNPGYEYLWDNGDTTNDITITNNVANTYTAIVTDQCLDYDTLSIFIDTYPIPAVDFTIDDTSGCQPLTVTLTNLTPAGDIGPDCIWTFSNGTVLTGCGTVTGIFNDPGCYDVELAVTSPNGCIGTANQSNMFCVFPNPVADFTWNPAKPTIYHGEVQFYNTSYLGDYYYWNFDSLGVSYLEDPMFNFTGQDSGDYQICLVATTLNGCVDTTCKDLHIYEDFAVYVPNVFTPDGDGINDQFFPVLSGLLENDDQMEFMIFNRWGELIYNGKGPRSSWDGTHKGIKSKEDVYVWKLKVRDFNLVKHEFVGHVTLLR